MNCKNIKQLLPLYLNEELDRQQFLSVKDHLDVCAGCRSELNELQEMDTLFKKYFKTKTAPDIRFSSISSKKRYYVLSSVAAAVLVFYLIFFALQPDEPNLRWENNRISELMEINDNLDLFAPDNARTILIFRYQFSAEDEKFYIVSEDVDYLQELNN